MWLLNYNSKQIIWLAGQKPQKGEKTVELQLRRKYQAVLFPALVLIFTAQMNMDLFISGFKISVAIIFLPLMMFLMEDFSPLPVALISAPGVFALRCVVQWLTVGTVRGAAAQYAPEMVFYLLYGLLFAFFVGKRDFRTFHIWYLLPLTIIDLCSNLGEMAVRLGWAGLYWQRALPLLVVALGRSLLAVGLIGAFDYYGLFLLRRDDRERYKKLLLLISRLKSEMVWMNKNMVYIENTMTTSYQLYSELSTAGQEQAAQKALAVAKDVHEIKKEYFLILKGMSDALNLEAEEEGMYFKNVAQILQESMKKIQQSLGKQGEIAVTCSTNFFTDKHYYLLSVFRNLITNSLEAAPQDRQAVVTLNQWEQGEDMVFQVHDNCGGIPKEYMENVFSAGFSTKISYKTGEVARGLGLTLVRDIVEGELGGFIEVHSQGGCTDFILRIPKQNLEATAK